MKSHEKSHRRQNEFIKLYPRHCEACWDCIEVCPKQALGKIEMGWHRHVIIENPEACNGCKKCVRACEHGALEYIYVPHSVSVPSKQPGLRQ
jgi:Fe-S-cluster-containing hydrogenase component 2